MVIHSWYKVLNLNYDGIIYELHLESVHNNTSLSFHFVRYKHTLTTI